MAPHWRHRCSKMAYRNIRLHPLLHLIYFLLRILVWFGLHVFYRRRLVLGRENLRFDGPAIVIANHPSTLMDPLNPALEIRQEMFFLANYGLFRHPVSNWLLRRLYCIPVKRKEDVMAGELRDNLQAFEQSFEHMEKNGVLFIAVEGTSWMNRFVRPLKSGAARIAFGAEARNNWQLDVKIIPVGLSYTAPHRFRSDVVVHVGKPVCPREWAALWKENQPKAIDALTGHLEQQLKTLSIHARDEAGELLLTRLEEIWQNEQPLSQRAAFERSQYLAQTVLNKPGVVKRTPAYFAALQAEGLTDAAVAWSWQPGLQQRFFWNGLGLLLGFPLFAIGYLFWFLPCFIPAWLNKKMNIYIGYSATVKMLTGLFTFPLALWGACRLATGLGLGNMQAALFLSVLILLGYFAEQYQDIFRRFQTIRKARYAARPNAMLDRLLMMRRAILEDSAPAR